LKETLPKFVLYQLRSRERDLDSLGTGTTFKAISGRVLRTFPLRWAPEQVQEEIVSKIDQLFSDLDAGVAALARAKANLARYRAAVLKAAVEGRLRVGPYRSLSYRSSGQALADGADGRDHEALWPTLTLGDLSEFVTSGSRGWSRYYSERGAMFIRSQDISQDRLDLSRVARVQLPHTSVEGARTRVQEGDVLITITGANVTRVAYVDGSIGEAYVSQHVALVRPHSPKSGSFLHLVLRSPTIRRRLLQLAYGAGKPGLNLDQLRQLSLPAPPLSEQSRTFRAVSRFEEAVERLAAVIAVAGIRSRALRAGVLVHAFAGRLT
jgi:type I restriction enzyme S subunit